MRAPEGSRASAILGTDLERFHALRVASEVIELTSVLGRAQLEAWPALMRMADAAANMIHDLGYDEVSVETYNHAQNETARRLPSRQPSPTRAKVADGHQKMK